MGAVNQVELRHEVESNPEPGEELRALFEVWAQEPSRRLPGVSPRRHADYALRSFAHAQEEGAESYLCRFEGQAEALLQLETLAWDTAVLGIPVARMSWWAGRTKNRECSPCLEELLHVGLHEASRRGTRYVFVRVPSDDLGSIHSLEANGFRFLDGLLTFGAKLDNSLGACEDSGLRCEPFQPADVPVLAEIAAGSFSVDRFHRDPAIPLPKADELLQKWIENSCNGFADCVLVARSDSSALPVGFTTLKVDRLSRSTLGIGIGGVVLVATAAQHRRQGVARSLTSAAVEWFRQVGCEWVEVGTQVANINASRVYQSAGFRLVNTSLTFRRLCE